MFKGLPLDVNVKLQKQGQTSQAAQERSPQKGNIRMGNISKARKRKEETPHNSNEISPLGRRVTITSSNSKTEWLFDPSQRLP